jgi:5-(carboxyamino)imidazole ribonucleotide synthase
VPLILESFVPFEREISIIAARGPTARSSATIRPKTSTATASSTHRPCRPRSPRQRQRQPALQPQRKSVGAGYVGVIGVEFFVLADGTLIANEIAPRVHNSGHWTEAACVVSQFEQHIRAVAGLALADGPATPAA